VAGRWRIPAGTVVCPLDVPVTLRTPLFSRSAAAYRSAGGTTIVSAGTEEEPTWAQAFVRT
jgi:hypothetical protein